MANPQDYELAELKAQVAALTGRIYRLEQKTGIAASAPQPQAQPQSAAPPPPPPVSAAMPSVAVPPPAFLASVPASEENRPNLESRIGQIWFNRIGIVAVLFGVAYFLKYAFDNNWIGAGGRVAIGMLAGIGLILWSESFRRKGHAPFSYSLKAVGLGTLYLSLWAAFQEFHLIPSQVAFAAMVIVTASAIVMAISQDAQLLATFALIGGFVTPLLVSTGENHEVALFSYVCLLDLAMLVLSRFKPWKLQLWLTFAGTVFWYLGWYLIGGNYTDSARPTTVLFASLFAAIFAAIPLVTPFERSRRVNGPSMTLTLVPLFNAANFFLALSAMYSSETITLTWYALALGAAYLGISFAFKSKFSGKEAQVIYLLHIAIAIAFVTIAIPLKLQHHSGHWITLGWLVESGVLLWIAVKTETSFMRYLAGVALGLGIFRLLVFDSSRMQETVIFNSRFVTYLVAIAIFGAILYYGKLYGSEREQPFVKLASIGFNLLALIAFTLEASDYFTRQQYQLSGRDYYAAVYGQLQLAKNFSFSAIWLLYGAGLMAVGFWKQSAFLRWQALVLMALTIGKVFLYDMSELDKGYRILSFIGLGVVLLAISFAYQRDWLKLSAGKAKQSTS